MFNPTRHNKLCKATRWQPQKDQAMPCRPPCNRFALFASGKNSPWPQRGNPILARPEGRTSHIRCGELSRARRPGQSLTSGVGDEGRKRVKESPQRPGQGESCILISLPRARSLWGKREPERNLKFETNIHTQIQLEMKL